MGQNSQYEVSCFYSTLLDVFDYTITCLGNLNCNLIAIYYIFYSIFDVSLKADDKTVFENRNEYSSTKHRFLKCVDSFIQTSCQAIKKEYILNFMKENPYCNFYSIQLEFLILVSFITCSEKSGEGSANP